jgi:hypothetical protein
MEGFQMLSATLPVNRKSSPMDAVTLPVFARCCVLNSGCLPTDIAGIPTHIDCSVLTSGSRLTYVISPETLVIIEKMDFICRESAKTTKIHIHDLGV